MDSGGLQVSEVSIARAIVAAVQRVPGVADVSPGRFAEAATYGPGEKVRGVAVGRAVEALDIEVHLCALYADSLVLPELAARVRSAVRQSVEALGVGLLRRIDVAFDDLYLCSFRLSSSPCCPSPTSWHRPHLGSTRYRSLDPAT